MACRERASITAGIMGLSALALLPNLAFGQGFPAGHPLVYFIPGPPGPIGPQGPAGTGSAAPLASNSAPGLMRGDGSTITVDPLTGTASVTGVTATPLSGPVATGDTFVLLRGPAANPTPYTVTLAQLQAGTAPAVTAASCNSSQVLTFPPSGNAAFDLTLTGACAVTLAGGTAGQVQTITLFSRQDATAGRVLTLPPGVKWPGGTAPAPGTAPGGIDVYTFTTPDARATVLGGY